MSLPSLPGGLVPGPRSSISGSPKTLSSRFLSAVGVSWLEISGWCRSNAGRSDRIRGSEVKLCRGGGQDVAHYSEAP